MAKSWVVCVALLVFGAAQAADGVIEKPLIAQSLDGFMHESTAIRDSMQPGGRYEFLKPEERSRVEARLNTMQALLQSHAGQDDLIKSDKVALINAQEEVNGILKRNDSNRLVCEHRAPIGSHIPVTSCRTYGEVEQQRQDAMKGAQDLSNLRRNPKSTGGGN